jgi:glycosyltransferase involved in cell wall biosynthesis
MKKKASIVICVYNEEKTIVYVVQSCHKYNKDAEIIVVDDGSNDSTSKLLADLEQEIPFIHIRFPENTGKSNAMAVGVENASNEIILFFDSDISGRQVCNNFGDSY